MLGEAGSNGGIGPNTGEYSVGVIVRLTGAAVAIFCTMVTLMTSLSSLPSSSISINPNVTTAGGEEMGEERERVCVYSLYK